MEVARVYDLATKFRLTTREVLERLQAAGIEALSFSSAIDESAAHEVLSRPEAKIPARTIRPGRGLPIQPARRRSLSPRPVPSQMRPAIPVKQEARAKDEPPSARPIPSVDITEEKVSLETDESHKAAPTAVAGCVRASNRLDNGDEPTDLIGKALRELRKGLGPYMEMELRKEYGAQWWAAGVVTSLNDQQGGPSWRGPGNLATKDVAALDVQGLLNVLLAQWGAVFRDALGEIGRAYILDVRDARNRWAHQEEFTPQEADKALRVMASLLRLIGAREAAQIVGLTRKLHDSLPEGKK